MTYELELSVSKDLAVKAGKAIMGFYQTEFSVVQKDNSEGPVTVADLAANRILCEGLSQSFPEDWICSEEVPDDVKRLDSRRVWCLDPLDGTKDFIAKSGQFAVQIGLIVDHVAVLGVVYLPAFNRLFYGGPERGAFMEEKGKTCSLSVNQSKTLDEMTAVHSRFHRADKVCEALKSLNIQKEITFGSLGCKVALIAEGKADLFVYRSAHTSEWDVCGPEAILRGAGGEMTDLLGRPLRYNKATLKNPGGVLASNACFHEQIRTALPPFP